MILIHELEGEQRWDKKLDLEEADCEVCGKYMQLQRQGDGEFLVLL